jgi:nicotinamide-nucleotide amidase
MKDTTGEKKMSPLPRVRILSTGSEITQGLYADSNAQELSRRLLDRGFHVIGHTAVPDDRGEIDSAIRASFGRCDLLVSTGGIGPTEDDLNREIFADAWGVGLRRIARAEAMMRARFARRGRVMPEKNLKQAFIPVGARPLLNFWGTAAGFLMPCGQDRPWALVMPGVPSEWRGMFDRSFARVVEPLFPGLRPRRVHTLHYALLPESLVNERVQDLFAADDRVEVGILAKRGRIRLRLAAAFEDAQALEALAARMRDRLPREALFAEGPEDATLEEAAVAALRHTGQRVALAESCTGGGIAHRLTHVPGSSAVLEESVVTYSNDAKQQWLGVEAALIAAPGAVSGECALAMARGLLARTQAHVALSVTGIAGPGGGSVDKPVGTVWIGLVDRQGVAVARPFHFPGDRDSVREWAENQALEFLRRTAMGYPLPEA